MHHTIVRVIRALLSRRVGVLWRRCCPLENPRQRQPEIPSGVCADVFAGREQDIVHTQLVHKAAVDIPCDAPNAAADNGRPSSFSERNDQPSWRRLTRPNEERPRAAVKAGSRLTKPSRRRGGVSSHQQARP